MNKILVGFFSMTLVLMLSMVSTTVNTVEASSSHASHSKAQKHKKARYKRKHRRSKKHRSKSRKKRRAVGGCQTLSRSTLQKKASPYNQAINRASQRHGVSKNLIKAVITIESCFKSRARGSLGEKGLMQLMPKTARHLNVKNGYNVSQNVHGGAKYLGYLLKHYNGNMQKAIAAYNAGQGNIDKGRIPNRRYVNKVLHAYRKFSSGKSEKAYQAKSKMKQRAKKETEHHYSHQKSTKSSHSKQHKSSQHTYAVKQGDTVYEVMRQTGTPVKKIIQLNGLKRPYRLQKGQSLQLTGSTKTRAKHRKSSNTRTADAYIVGSNDTVYNVMRQTGVPVKKIIRLNNLSIPYSISAGQELRLR